MIQAYVEKEKIYCHPVSYRNKLFLKISDWGAH